MRRRNRRLIRIATLTLAAPAVSALTSCAGPAGPAGAAAPPPPAAATAPVAATQPLAPAPPSRLLAIPRDIPGVGNFAQISPGLYRGSQPTAEGFAELKRRGIKTIVNLRWIHSDRGMLRGTGLRYAHIHALPWAPGDRDAAAFFKLLENPDNYPVYVHCQHGSDRTGYLVAVYRIMEQGWPMDDALREMRAFGYHPIWFQVVAYLRHFRSEGLRTLLKKAPAPKVEVIQ